MFKHQYELVVTGLACLDVLNHVEQYPEEDSDSRCLQQKWALGGNAVNSSNVLAQYEIKPLLIATYCDDYTRSFIEQEIARQNLPMEGLILRQQGQFQPVSTATISKTTGSRTIIHAPNNMTEPKLSEFVAKLEKTDSFESARLFHFEGRNVGEVAQMIKKLADLRTANPTKLKYRICVELEKKRAETDALLLSGVDIYIIGRAYALSRDFATKKDVVENFVEFCREKCGDCTASWVVCAWGEEGACGLDCATGAVWDCGPAVKTGVVDTLGTGDTFVAGILLSALSDPTDLRSAVEFANGLAGVKCQRVGLEGLTDVKRRL